MNNCVCPTNSTLRKILIEEIHILLTKDCIASFVVGGREGGSAFGFFFPSLSPSLPATIAISPKWSIMERPPARSKTLLSISSLWGAEKEVGSGLTFEWT